VSRPWQVALTFGLFLAVGLAALGWLTATVVRLDRAELAARRQAALEESARLALWRMDSALAPLIAREAGRPYFVYRSFYPAERAYTRMFSEIRHGVLVPSPLLTSPSPYVLLHFQIDAAGEFTSPQVPTGNMRDLAAPRYVDAEQFARAEARLQELAGALPRAALADLPLEQLEPADRVVVAGPPQSPSQAVPPQAAGPGQGSESLQQRQQAQRSTLENLARSRAMQLLAQPEASGAADVQAGGMTPRWLGARLLLARRVAVDRQEYIQGCWLDWPALRPWLLDQVADLFPQAQLEPAPAADAQTSDRVLAALPVRLRPGEPALADVAPRPPLRLMLVLAWAGVLGAAAAVLLLLVGTVALSERRAAFVSAVTHELRTPLTTFRLYTEMLADGLVRDEPQRRSYLQTLQAEALRLGHLVENVLAYARLERGRLARRSAAVDLRELLDRLVPRLRARADQAGLELVVDGDVAAVGLTVRADPGAVEQVLFNLVDNACKYAAAAEPKRIRLVAGAAGTHGWVRVCDHGPGIGPAEARRLFRPFRKSARQAANSAPGVGLGLARAMDGDLRLLAHAGPGACFELRLPR
jgi:signal transduction histidine kinase